MSVELKVVYEGTAPGLENHRLSLNAFAEPLRLLLSALQRTASGLCSQALDDPAYGSRGGQLAADAKLLDLELSTIATGSVAPEFVCVARNPAGQQRFFPPGLDLAERALERLLRDIEAEVAGKLRNSSARNYLASMPPGVSRQRYTALRDGEVIADVVVSAPTLPVVPTPLPRVIQVSGHITSVGFEPGTPFIQLKTDGRSIKCAATAKHVEIALGLRTVSVTAAILDGEKPTILWLRDSTQQPSVPPLTDTLEQINTVWKTTMETLAR